MKIGYLGPEGTFSYEALKTFLSTNTNIKAELLPCLSFSELQYLFLEQKPWSEQIPDLIDKIFIPIENSIGGGVVSNLDFLTLIAEKNIYIETEYIQPIHHAIGSGDGEKKNINIIISHQQPIDQCYEYIKHNFPTAKIEYAESTASGAEKVISIYKQYIASLGGSITQAGKIATSMYNYAAIASEKTLLANGLQIIDRNIEDNKNNVTRFVLLGKEKTKPTDDDKTSIAITLPADKAGALHEVLGVLANSTPPINMTKIESRPTKDEMGEYWFFIDIEGHQDDPHIGKALNEIKAKSKEYKFLGSYPRFRK